MRRLIICLFAWVSAALPCRASADDSSPQADSLTLTIGSKSIIVPYPEGFVRMDGIDPGFDKFRGAFIPEDYRILAGFGRPEDQAKLKAHISGTYVPHLYASTYIPDDNEEFDRSFFANFVRELKPSMQGPTAKTGERAKAVVAEGKERLKKTQQIESTYEVTGASTLGSFEESETSYGWTVAAEATEMNAGGTVESRRSLNLTLISLVCGKILYLKADYLYTTEEDRKTAEKTVLAWRDSLVKANPHVDEPMAQNRLPERIGKAVGRFAIIGAVIAVIVVISKRRAARAG